MKKPPFIGWFFLFIGYFLPVFFFSRMIFYSGIFSPAVLNIGVRVGEIC
jgi:hypothetical protein